MPQLALGTAQFGLDYGISNKSGVTPPKEVSSILRRALERGVRMLDTAPVYGESEAVLGREPKLLEKFSVVTKTPHLDSLADPRALEASLRESLERLGLEFVHGMLIHRVADILQPASQKLIDSLQELKSAGLVKKIGVSVYRGQEIDAVLKLFTPDIVQLPLSLFDQRLVSSGHLAKLYELGVEIHSRSAFLQGAIFLDKDELPAHLQGLRPQLENIDSLNLRPEVTKAGLALAYQKSLNELSNVIVGVCNQRQLEEVVDSFEIPLDQDIDWNQFSVSQEEIVDPSKWPS